MSLLEERFRQARSKFIPFLVAGDPDLQTSADLLVALSALDPVAIEVGVPFSDPTADGPVIQRSGQRALSRGTNLSTIFEMLRRNESAPVVLFGYYNPILQFGIDKFVRAASEAHVAGVLVVDLPAEAAEPLQRALRKRKIDLIFLVAPTTSTPRLKRIARLATGFIYAVSRTGVTGTVRALADESEQLVRQIRAVTDLPVAVGFGITTGERARRVCRYADAAVVGSRIVQEIEQSQKLSRVQLVKRVMKVARQFVV
jgi:tryptophan synthase alpha chain